MSEIIDNDFAGTQGQTLFDGCCAEVGLVSNPSVKDRTGWDRIVEFPQPDVAVISTLDKRPAPISCHVQIKTVPVGAHSVRFRLSSLERLVKDPKPAFVYVISGIRTDAPKAHLIHLRGEALAYLLHRLRQEDSDFGPNVRVNKKSITLPLSLGAPLPIKGEALKVAIEQAVGGPTGLHDYIASKEHELNNLGFEEFRYHGRFTIESETTEELVEGLLGLKPLVATSFEAAERRFGIEITDVDLRGIKGEVRITPTTPKACRLVCTKGAGHPPAILDGELRAPGLPGLPAENVRLLFRHQLFDMLIPLVAERPFRLNGHYEVWATGKLEPQVWLNMQRMMSYVSETGASLRLHPEGLPPIEFIHDSSSGGPDPARSRAFQKICSNLIRLRDLLAVETLRLTWDEVLASAEDVANCLAFVDGKVGAKFLKFNTIDNEPPPRVPMRFVYFYIVPIGEHFVAYAVDMAVQAVVSGGKRHWSANAKKLIDFVWIASPDVEYPAFQERIEKRTGCSNKIAWGSRRLAGAGRPDEEPAQQTAQFKTR